MTILSADMNDVINMADRAIMKEIALTDDHPVLMINQNLYTEKADFPNGELYKRWRAINQKMIKKSRLQPKYYTYIYRVSQDTHIFIPSRGR